MSNYVNYQVEMTEANATVIDTINGLLLPGYNSGTTEKKAPAKSEKKTGLSMTDVKKVIKSVKAEHGEEHIRSALASVGVDDGGLSLAKALSAVDTADYQTFVDAMNEAPEASDDLEDDEFEDDNETVSVEDVQAAVKAFAKSEGKEEAREAMKKCKAAKLSDIADISEANLTKLFGLVS